MRSMSNSIKRIGLLLAPAFLLACSNASPSNDGGTPPTGPISFRNDLLTAPPPAITFEFSCGLSSSCHNAPVHNPKTDRLFLGCNTANASCTASGDVAAQVYAGLVGNPDAGMLVMSQENPSMPYVTPGNPDQSWLVHKLEGTLMGITCVPAAMDPIVANATSEPVTPTPDCGTQMPLTAMPDATFNAKVRAWVQQGALDN